MTENEHKHFESIDDLRGYVAAMPSVDPQSRRIEAVKSAVAAIRGVEGGSMLSTASQEPITEVSDVIYLADFIERGPESYWLQRDDEVQK